MLEVMLTKIEKMYGGNKILRGATFPVLTGEKVGLVGRNGSGKSTLLKIIAGLETCDSGDLTTRKGASVGYLDQIPELPERSKVIDVLHMAFEEQFELFRRMRELAGQMERMSGDEPEYEAVMDKYGTLLQLYEQKEGFSIDEKVGKVCNGLKIGADFFEREFRTLSGGEKTTVILGRILLQNPDILLLDEPTNHLDMESAEWLEGFLSKYRGTVIIVSHDRYFLDRVIHKIVDVENGKAETYTGNYSEFRQEKEKRMLERAKKYAQQENKIKQLEKAAHDLREWGKAADNPGLHKRAENIEKRIERMDKVEKPMLQENSIPLVFANTELRSKDVVRAGHLTKAFGQKKILANLDLHVRYREKVALVGRNGAGKSTLFKMLLGEYLPDEGDVIVGSGTRIAYVEQNISFECQDNTVLEEFRANVSVSEGEARRLLAKFAFKGEDVFKSVKNISGGEKSRLRLCQLMQQNVNFLVLDEPTNHLDIHSMEVLEKALTEFAGTILFISHDRYFINRLADRILELREGKLVSYPGNYEYYAEKKAQEKLKDCTPRLENPSKREKGTSYRDTACEYGAREKTNGAGQMTEIEDRIELLELKIRAKTEAMESCSADFARLTELYRERVELEEELEKLAEQWLT
ncbi:putative ABC transporter ATP-binding protein [Peptococcaceae bacterium CEB3]|nr:putative ABC transporter ATP-binding protein [Peptococcaceae bacterium CEB3]